MARGADANIKRTTLSLDLIQLKRAKKTLGTKTARETVNRALHEVNRQADLRHAAALVREGGLNIVQPGDLPDLRRHRGS